MNSTAPGGGAYVLGRTDQEYDRLRAQARVWEAATGRLLDRVAVACGARCLDAGCGPGETMRLLAQRVGPTGHVCGVDLDEGLGRQAIAALHADGHRQCAFTATDLEDATDPIPGAPYDVVYARLLLFHVTARILVLRRLWAAVAPGGHLIVHDYDLLSTNVLPDLESMQKWRRVVFATFTAAGCDIQIGHRLPSLFAAAGIGVPDGTDVAGRLENVSSGGSMLVAVYRSLLPAAVAQGLTTDDDGRRWQEDFRRDMIDRADDPLLWPLLLGVWKRKAGGSR